MAKLSVIIPVYGSVGTLERCVDSVLSQNVNDMEIILVDDGSRDGGAELCDTLAARHACIRVIHRENGGLSAARNTGLDAATGEFIAFADSDDELAAGTLSDNLALMETDTDILEFPVTVHYGAPNSHVLRFTPRSVRASDSYTDWLESEGYMHCYAWNKIYRSGMFRTLRFPVGETFEDAATCPDLIRQCRSVRYSDMGMYLYHASPGGITGRYTFKVQEPLFRHNLRLLEDSATLGSPACRARLWSLCMNLLIDLVRCQEPDPSYIGDSAARLAALAPSAGNVLHSGMSVRGRFKTLLAITVGPSAMCRLFGIRKYSK